MGKPAGGAPAAGKPIAKLPRDTGKVGPSRPRSPGRSGLDPTVLATAQASAAKASKVHVKKVSGLSVAALAGLAASIAPG